MSRHPTPTRSAQIEALLSGPLIFDIAARLDEIPRRKRRNHPTALHLAYGALARLHHSQNRLDAELATTSAWHHLLEIYNTGAAAHPAGESVPPRYRKLTTDSYRSFRNWICDDPYNLAALQDAFTQASVAAAQTIGLLDPNGPGSITRPHPTRTVYGDGTIVRPVYSQSPTGTRIDHDAARHTRHDGTITGNNLVHLSVRGPEHHRRIILGIDRTPRPGLEAGTSVELIRRVHGYAGGGIQAVVYDGAFRGVHHQTLMHDLGLVVINKVHPISNNGETREWRPLLLGQWTHPTGRRRTCSHTLVAHNGAVCDTRTNDTGQLQLSDPLPRRQVRRYPRPRRGGWRFSVGVDIDCPLGAFTAWISPHPGDPADGTGRADQLRLVPAHDPLFAVLYGLRNDAEAINAEYKRTLLADRAATLGWQRQILDLTSWAFLGNSLAMHLHRPPLG